jgi:hypothetical protein
MHYTRYLLQLLACSALATAAFTNSHASNALNKRHLPVVVRSRPRGTRWATQSRPQMVVRSEADATTLKRDESSTSETRFKVSPYDPLHRDRTDPSRRS